MISLQLSSSLSRSYLSRPAHTVDGTDTQHFQPEHLDPTPLFGSDDATLWRIDTTNPDVVADDYVRTRLATTTIWSLDKDHTYALLVLRDRFTWTDEAVPVLLRYVATQLHGQDTNVTDTFSIEVFRATAGGRTVWRREDYADDPK